MATKEMMDRSAYLYWDELDLLILALTRHERVLDNLIERLERLLGEMNREND